MPTGSNNFSTQKSLYSGNSVDNTFDATGATVEFTSTGGTLKLGGATVNSIGNTFTEGSGTVEYDYAGAQNIKTRTYYNLNR